MGFHLRQRLSTGKVKLESTSNHFTVHHTAINHVLTPATNLAAGVSLTRVRKHEREDAQSPAIKAPEVWLADHRDRTSWTETIHKLDLVN